MSTRWCAVLFELLTGQCVRAAMSPGRHAARWVDGAAAPSAAVARQLTARDDVARTADWREVGAARRTSPARLVRRLTGEHRLRRPEGPAAGAANGATARRASRPDYLQRAARRRPVVAQVDRPPRAPTLDHRPASSLGMTTASEPFARSWWRSRCGSAMQAQGCRSRARSRAAQAGGQVAGTSRVTVSVGSWPSLPWDGATRSRARAARLGVPPDRPGVQALLARRRLLFRRARTRLRYFGCTTRRSNRSCSEVRLPNRPRMAHARSPGLRRCTCSPSAAGVRYDCGDRRPAFREALDCVAG